MKARDRLRRLLAEGHTPADAYRELQRSGGAVPARATAYEWARQWREEREADDSGVWTLERDQTGRPDLVMRVLAALRWHRAGADAQDPALRLSQPVYVTHDEAGWIVRLGVALPWILAEREYTEDDVRRHAHPLLELLQLAQLRIGMTQRGASVESQADMDAMMAGFFTEDGRYRDAR